MSEQTVEGQRAGHKFYVNVEGVEHPWSKETITTAEIRTLGSIPADQSIIEENPEGVERTLSEDETIEIKPEHRLGRAPKYRRGGREGCPWQQ